MKKDKVYTLVIALLLTLILFVSILQVNALAYNEPKRRAFPKSIDFYDTSFWNVTKAINEPLNISQVSSITKSYENISLNVTDIFFLSEVYNGHKIWIFAEILIPLNFTFPLPAILVIHGYGGSHTSLLEFGYEIAKEGYVVILIDAPDSGQSTKYPSKAPESLINTTIGPYDSYFYHVAWAGLRAITVLEHLSDVDKNRIAVTGGSMGGIMSFIIGAIDPRVKATIPIVAGGNFEDCFLAASLTVPLTTPDAKFSSEEIQKFIKYFDVYAYARLLKIPTLMLSSTNDEFFTLIGLNDTYSVISSEKWWFLAPNWHHFSAYPGWIQTTVSFLNYVFNGGPPLPKITFNSSTSVGLTVSSSIDIGGGSLLLIWRHGLPGDTWKISAMHQSENKYFITLYPTFSGKITYYVALKNEATGLFVVTTFPKSVAIGFSYSIVALLLLILALVGLTFYLRYDISINDMLSFSKYDLVYYTLLVIGFLGLWIDWITFVNKLSFSYFEFIERYGNTFKINPYGSVIPILIFSAFFVCTLFYRKELFSFIPLLIFSLITFSVLFVLQMASKGLLIVQLGIGGWATTIAPIILVLYITIFRFIAHSRN
ncbi:MAG: alpha/beta hydrolase [Candidatus Asgardarchaeia archaeon]